MNYKFRIPVENEYLLAIGRATYNFIYLEKIIVDIIAKLSEKGHGEIPPKATAGTICKVFEKLIPTFPEQFQNELIDLHDLFKDAVDTKRNKLLHAYPYTSLDGTQQVSYPNKEWSLEAIYEIAKEFELIAIRSNKLYHDKIATTKTN